MASISRKVKAWPLCSWAALLLSQTDEASAGEVKLLEREVDALEGKKALLRGFVRLRFKKLGFDGVNVYTRRRRESAWRFLARDTNSPYDDHSDLEKPGTPEVREYHLVGVVKDQEQGQPTDAVSVTSAG